MKNSLIFRVILLGAIAIAGIIGMQAYWVINTWNINEEEFSKKASLALYRTACGLADLSGGDLPPRNIVNQRTTNSYVVNIDSEIDDDHLEYFLQKEFERLALYADFEYAVFDCTTNEMLYGNYCSFNPGKQTDLTELGDLPKDDKFTYYFSVKFPNRSGYLFGKMQLSIFFSAILLIVLLFFAYSMYIMLRQKRLSELQKDFINNMTHEFKTPISTIKISADVFQNAPELQGNQRLMRYASIIKEQNTRLNSQVEKVLQLARIEQGNFELKQERFSVPEALTGIVNSTTVQVEKQGGILDSDIQLQETHIEADRLHFTNILHNLMDNAIKYCKDEPQIKLSAFASERQIHIQIKDQGVGISKEHLGRIFSKFYRVPTGDVHKVKGFGLGLYYVKSICDAQGWQLNIESTPNEGTTVHLQIPVIQQGLKSWWLNQRTIFSNYLRRTATRLTNA
ncbi:MAG: HAMP domain-containing histidine kinase [Mameliella sp.]|nr:HAMP domain-containing histidine kinase [Phaeodactylibacter sp.]NRA48451.1 HAMP domain-containing histidine kinase [Phaeodactylibacter sp.]